MTVLRSVSAALTAALLVAPGAVLAQGAADPVHAPAAAPMPPAPPPPLTRTTIDLGFVSATGNTRIRTLNVGEQFILQPGPWKFTQTFAIVNGYTNGLETANNIRAGLRADYAFTPHLRAYAMAGYTRDRFAGIDRRFEEAAGVSYGALVGPEHILDLEAGAGRNQQRGGSGPVLDYWLARVAAHYRWTFRPGTYVDEKLELFQSLQESNEQRTNSELALVAPLVKGLALRFGYVIHYVKTPPDSTFKKTDQVVSMGLQVSF